MLLTAFGFRGTVGVAMGVSKVLFWTVCLNVWGIGFSVAHAQNDTASNEHSLEGTRSQEVEEEESSVDPSNASKNDSGKQIQSDLELRPGDQVDNPVSNVALPAPMRSLNSEIDFTDGQDQMFLVTLLLGIITLLSVGTSFWLYRWRSLIIDNERVLVPERWASAMDMQTKTHQQMSRGMVSLLEVMDTRNQEVWQKLSDLNETIDTMRKAITKRDQTIDRLQEGQDTFVFRRFLCRFIEVGQEFNQQCSSESGGTVDVELLRDLLWQSIEECGVEEFEPEIGGDYLTAKGVADRPIFDECHDPSKHNMIARVIKPGFCVPNGNDNVIIVPAKVAVWRIPDEA